MKQFIDDIISDAVGNIIMIEKNLGGDFDVSLALARFSLDDLKTNINYLNKHYPNNPITMKLTEHYAVVNAQYQLMYGLDRHKP